MKEKLKKWISEEKVCLALLWFNVASFLFIAIKGLISGAPESVCVGFLIFAPWVMFFWGWYEHTRFRRNILGLVGKQSKVMDKLYNLVVRYHDLYGDLPKENTNEEQSKENEHGEENE